MKKRTTRLAALLLACVLMIGMLPAALAECTAVLPPIYNFELPTDEQPEPPQPAPELPTEAPPETPTEVPTEAPTEATNPPTEQPKPDTHTSDDPDNRKDDPDETTIGFDDIIPLILIGALVCISVLVALVILLLIALKKKKK